MTEETKPTATPASGKGGRGSGTIPKKYHSEIISLWRIGDVTIQDLIAKYGGKEQSYRNLFARHKVKKGDKAAEVAAKRDAAIEAALTLDPAVHARRVFDTKNETYRILEMLRKLVAQEIVQARQKGNRLSSIQNDMKAIREAAAAIKICREEAYAVLGITPDQAADDQLPDLNITGLDEDQIADLQASAAESGLDEMDDLMPQEVDEDLEGDNDIVIEGEEDDGDQG